MNPTCTTHPIEGVRSKELLLTAKVTGGGAASNCTVDTNGEIESVVYASATGKYTVTFRRTFPELKCAPVGVLVGTTDGLRASFSAIDIAAGTATMETWVGSTATDMATTDIMHFMWVVRDSGANS